MIARTLVVLSLLLIAAPSHAQAPPAAVERPPECGTMVGISEGFADAFIELGIVMYAILTRVLPDAGYVHDLTLDRGWAQLSWPLDLAFAPETGRTVYPRKCTDDVVFKANASRVLLEPMLRLSSVESEFTARFHVRPAYRFVYRASESKIGFGAGVGSTVDFAGGLEASLSPEAVFSVGKCCSPSYFTIAARYDRYFASARNVVSLQLGWTYH